MDAIKSGNQVSGTTYLVSNLRINCTASKAPKSVVGNVAMTSASVSVKVFLPKVYRKYYGACFMVACTF